MGKRGPPRTPTNILKMRGSWRAKERTDEPKPEIPSDIACPEWVPEDGKRLWDEVVPPLFHAGLMTSVDVLGLARYCEAFHQYLACVRFLERKGTAHPITDERGRVIAVRAFPQLAQRNALADQMQRLEREFGMTPAARANLARPPEEETASPFRVLGGG